MFHHLEATTANGLWQQAARKFGEGGLSVAQDSRGGTTHEIMNAALAISDPRQRWISARVPPMNPAFAIAEVIWILNGREDSGMLNYFNPQLPKYAGTGATYHGAYGHRIRRRFGIDQLERGFEALTKNPESRQVVLQIWEANTDLPALSGKPISPDIPCNICSLIKVRNNRLQWCQVMRSNDLFRGFPHNVIQFTALQEVFAGWLGLELGDYHHYSDSLHFYEHDGPLSERIEEIDPPKNTDSLSFPKDVSDAAFTALSDFCDACCDSDTTPAAVLAKLKDTRFQEPHRNLARVLAADSLRRRKEFEMMDSVIRECGNECLRFMFERWLRKSKATPAQAFGTGFSLLQMDAQIVNLTDIPS